MNILRQIHFIYYNSSFLAMVKNNHLLEDNLLFFQGFIFFHPQHYALPYKKHCFGRHHSNCRYNFG